MEPDPLLARLRAGDAAAFDLLYARCNPRLFRFARRLARSSDLAEELVQETWLRCAQHARTLPDDTEPAAWLFAVLRNLYLSHRRRRLLGRAWREAWWDWLTGGQREHSPLEHLAATETQCRLEAALGALPTPQREVVLLVVIERLEPAQVARVLGIHADAVRQRLARARQRLARSLAPDIVLDSSTGETP
jgi:RNA polymerase sigma factor (sigma-70 family)